MKTHAEIHERLAARGLRLRYEYQPHLRMTLRFGKSGIRHVVMAHIVTGERECYSGTAILHPEDRFVKAKGREIALRRALVAAKKLELVTGDDIAYCMSDWSGECMCGRSVLWHNSALGPVIHSEEIRSLKIHRRRNRRVKAALRAICRWARGEGFMKFGGAMGRLDSASVSFDPSAVTWAGWDVPSSPTRTP